MKKRIRYQIIFILLMPLYPLFAFDDSDIFHEKVFLKAVKKSDYAKASEMIQMNVSVNSVDSDGLVPIAYALANEDSKMFDLLSDAGARINIKILDDSSLLIFYINNNRFKLIDKLIEHGSNLNKQDSNGMTALMHAIEKSNVNAVGMLSRKNLDTSLTDFSGKTIFDYSNLSRNISIKRIVEKLEDF